MNSEMNLVAVVHSLWAQILAIIAVVIWLIRWEARTNANASEIRRLWKQREEDLRAHKEAREATNSVLSEVKDDLHEVRQDIKTLLARGGSYGK